MILVSSKALLEAAEHVKRMEQSVPGRTLGSGTELIPSAGVEVNFLQLEAAARILQEAEPSICNGDVQERPGFIERGDQIGGETLVFRMGILPSHMYHIDRTGGVVEHNESA